MLPVEIKDISVIVLIGVTNKVSLSVIFKSILPTENFVYRVYEKCIRIIHVICVSYLYLIIIEINEPFSSF